LAARKEALSGDLGRPWTAIHDNQRIPADFRLYLTATPRILAAARPQKGTDGEELEIATMADDPDGTYGAWLAELGLSKAIEREILAGLEIDVLEIRDPSPVLGESEEARRGRRLALLTVAGVAPSWASSRDRSGSSPVATAGQARARTAADLPKPPKAMTLAERRKQVKESRDELSPMRGFMDAPGKKPKGKPHGRPKGDGAEHGPAAEEGVPPRGQRVCQTSGVTGVVEGY